MKNNQSNGGSVGFCDLLTLQGLLHPAHKFAHMGRGLFAVLGHLLHNGRTHNGTVRNGGHAVGLLGRGDAEAEAPLPA